MVNLLNAYKPLRHRLMKMAGISPYSVEIEAGTTMHFWVPSETLKAPKNTTRTPKPAVILLHGFAAEGIFTWQLQVGSLTKKYSVYVPDLLFFGKSTTDRADRTPVFQAECLAKALKKLGVEKCTVVGFSYGGMVGFKLAEIHPQMVEALVVSGAIPAITDTVNNAMLTRLGFRSLSELLMPDSVNGLKALFKIGTCKDIWVPDRFHKDFLQVMFTNRKERSELLEALVITNKNYTPPNFPQRIHFLWGENDQILGMELAQNFKQQLGKKATFESIKKAGHLVHLERPCVYNRRLKQFLASLYSDEFRK